MESGPGDVKTKDEVYETISSECPLGTFSLDYSVWPWPGCTVYTGADEYTGEEHINETASDDLK